MKELENWKAVVGQEGRYEVSSLGRVRSLLTKKVLREGINRKGYSTVRLHFKGEKRGQSKSIEHRIHRLVAKAFLNTEENETVNHINGIKLDNHYKNLEWMSNMDNWVHAKEMGLLKKNKGMECYQAVFNEVGLKKIKELRNNGFGAQRIANRMCVSKSTIQKILKGKSYKNEYANC